MKLYGKNFVLLWFILFLSFPSEFNAGDNLKEWGEVAPEYLNMTVFDQDTSAVAIKIFDQAIIGLEIVNELEMTFERHFQTKILKEKGKDFADMSISYWHEDYINNIEAQVIQPDGETIELEDENIFDEEAKGRFKVKKLAFPNVQVGSILEVKYKLKSTSIHELEPWYFHQSIPVVESEILIHLSPFFAYMVKTDNDPEGLVVASEGEYFNRIRDNWGKEYSYKAVNLPAIKREPFISCLDNYRANINFQIESVTFPGYHRKFIEDTKTLCNRMLDHAYKDFEEPDSEVQELVEKLIEPGMNSNEKAKVLFEYVRDNLNSDINSSIYVRKDQEEILEEKKASDTEKNMLLKVMLQAVGFEAHPVLISTRYHGLAKPDIPFLSQYNKVILLVKIDENYFLFDARDPWITYGQLPPSSLVKNALLLQRDNQTYLEIPNGDLKSMSIIESHLNINPEDRLAGSSELLSVGYGSRKFNKYLNEHESVESLFMKNWLTIFRILR